MVCHNVSPRTINYLKLECCLHQFSYVTQSTVRSYQNEVIVQWLTWLIASFINPKSAITPKSVESAL